MRVSTATLAAAALVFAYSVSAAVGQSVDQVADCKTGQVPKKAIVNGKIVIKCVRAPGTGTPAQQFGDFIHGNRFHHGKHSYTFCAPRRYTARNSHGTYKVVNAKRVRRKDGRVTITAQIRLKPVSGRRSTLRAMLTMRGLKIDGEMFGFGGPAPPAAKCAPA